MRVRFALLFSYLTGAVVDYTLVTLPNGLRLITAPMSHLRSVSVECFFAVGSRYESPELAGVSHFIEHMLFKGSENYPTAQAISETIEGVGGMLDAATDREVTAYSAKVASRHLELGAGVAGRHDPASALRSGGAGEGASGDRRRVEHVPR